MSTKLQHYFQLILKNIPCWGDAHEDAKKTSFMKHKFDISQHKNFGVDQGEIKILDIGQGGWKNGQVEKDGGASTSKGDDKHGYYHFEKKCHLARSKCDDTFHFA